MTHGHHDRLTLLVTETISAAMAVVNPTSFDRLTELDAVGLWQGPALSKAVRGAQSTTLTLSGNVPCTVGTATYSANLTVDNLDITKFTTTTPVLGACH